MSAITINDFEWNPSQYVWLNNGQLTIDSMFNKYFLGNKNLLLACIEDNMTDTEINYYEAINDYRESGECLASEKNK